MRGLRKKRGGAWPRLLAALLLPACDSARGGPSSGEAHSPALAAYACAQPIPRDTAEARGELRRGYEAWRERYLTAEGAGGFLRVRMPTADDATSSEGIAYGMILAAYMRDRESFDALWSYAGKYRNPRGLMAWEVSAEGEVLDRMAATDADEDMAFALLVAEGEWRGYAADARALIDSLMMHAVEPGTRVFRPGDRWGGSAVTNPSYFAPAYYKLFARVTGDERWTEVADTSYAILDRVVRKHSPGAGLAPEWLSAAGDSALGRASDADDGFEFDYGYNATRLPWRLAMDAAWNCDARARGHLARLNAFFHRVGAAGMVDGYRLDGTPASRWHTAAFVGPALAATLLSDDRALRDSFWRETVRLRHEGYYHDSLRLLSLLLAAGGMPPPAP